MTKYIVNQQGKDISEEDIDALKQSYNKAQENSGVLSLKQLDCVVGGLKGKIVIRPVGKKDLDAEVYFKELWHQSSDVKSGRSYSSVYEETILNIYTACFDMYSYSFLQFEGTKHPFICEVIDSEGKINKTFAVYFDVCKGRLEDREDTEKCLQIFYSADLFDGKEKGFPVDELGTAHMTIDEFKENLPEVYKAICEKAIGTQSPYLAHTYLDMNLARKLNSDPDFHDLKELSALLELFGKKLADDSSANSFLLPTEQ